MSCDISHGRVEACKSAVSGLDAIYFINYEAGLADTATYDNTDTDLITALTPNGNLYKYELKGNNGFTQTINTSRENGTTTFTQTLTVELKNQDVKIAKEVKLLAYGRPHIIVRTTSQQYFIVGLRRGADMTAGSIESGVKMADFNGYKLTFTAEEICYANFLDCSTESELNTLLNTVTITTS